MHRFWLLLLCLSFTTSVFTQQVSISGMAKDFANGQAILFQLSDPISGKREAIEIKNINDEGKFSFNFSIKETQSVLVSVARMEGLLYVEPNKQYEIVFPAATSADAKRFDRTEVALDLSNLPENDLNLLIRKFNADYISFINNHYYDFVSDEFKGSDVYRSTLGDKMKKSDMYKMPSAQDSVKEVLSDFPHVATVFMSQMEKKYQADFSNTYFKDYVKYALAEIKLLSGLNRQRFYREYFHALPVLYNNTAYMKTFNTFYNGLLKTDTNAKRDSLTKLINATCNVQRISDYYKNDSTILDNDIRMSAILLNLKSAYFDKLYSKPAVIRTLESVPASNGFQKEMATNIISQLKRFDRGHKYEDFVVGDSRDEKWRFSENLTMPTYLFFFATWNTASVKEMLVLEKLYSTYKNDVQIIAICMDDNYENYKKYIREHKSQQFKMLYGAGDALMTEKYNVRSIPYAVFLNADGEWMFSYTRRPSEGVEDDFKRIKMNNSKPNEGRKTWRDK